MTMNLKKDFTLTFFDHRLFPMPAFGGLFSFKISPLGEISYESKKEIVCRFIEQILHTISSILNSIFDSYCSAYQELSSLAVRFSARASDGSL